MPTPLIVQVVRAFDTPSECGARARKIATFISRALSCFSDQFPKSNGRFTLVLEDLRNGRSYPIPGEAGLWTTTTSKAVVDYMRERFDPDVSSFDLDLDVAMMVCFDKICLGSQAKIAVMAYNVCALKWLMRRYGIDLHQTIVKMHQLAASRNRFALMWPELLNLTGEKLPSGACFTCATTVARADRQRCGGCRTTSYCSRACQKADWPRHRKECVAMAPPGSRFRTHVHFAKFYCLHCTDKADPSLDSLCSARLTVMPPKRSLASLQPNARDILLARNERMGLIHICRDDESVQHMRSDNKTEKDQESF
jgi:hypothetical protein